MSTVNQLISTIKKSGGVAKGNRYRIIFDSSSDKDKLDVICDSVTWPGRQIATTDYMTTMQSLKKPYAFVNEDITISFILMNDWYAWNYLNNWETRTISGVTGRTSDYKVNLKSDYSKNIIIQHLDEQDRVRKEVTIYSAYPTSLNSIELSNANENTILRCSAVFTYDNWVATDTSNTLNNVSDINRLPLKDPNEGNIIAPNYEVLPGLTPPNIPIGRDRFTA